MKKPEIKFKDIPKKITGISTPFGGISWNATDSEKDLARRILTFLEDRRVLYSPFELELPEHCVDSINDIRQYLTNEITVIGEDYKLTEYLRGMRSACRKFMDVLSENGNRVIIHNHYGRHEESKLLLALGELRATFGIIIYNMLTKYELNIEEDLYSICPREDKE